MEEGGEDDEYEEECKHSARPSRCCRKLKISNPCDAAAEKFFSSQLETTTELEGAGMVQLFRSNIGPVTAKHIPAAAKQTFAASSSSSQSKTQFNSGVKATRQLAAAKFTSHVRDLKLKRHISLAGQPTYISPRPEERSGVSAHSTLACLMRDNSNHVAICNKRKTSEAAAQQTTRVHIGTVGVADVAYQITTRLVVGLGASTAKQLVASSTDGSVHVCNPHCSFAYDGNDLLDRGDKRDVFLRVASARHFCEDAPRSVCKRDFLQVCIDLARKELDHSYISAHISQTTTHLKLTCNKICNSTDGTKIWFAFALLLYLVSDVRAHRILETEGFTDFDVALAEAISAYSHLLVGNRSRRQIDEINRHLGKRDNSDNGGVDGNESSCAQKRRKLFDAIDVLQDMSIVEHDWMASDPPAVLDALSLEDVSSAMCASRNSILSKKVRRSPGNNAVGSSSSSSSNASVSTLAMESPQPKKKKLRYTGALGIRSLEFWHLHFAQSDAYKTVNLGDSSSSKSTVGSQPIVANCCLKHLVSEDSNASKRAALKVLEWQMSSVHTGEDLMQLSQDAALYTRSQMLNLLMQNERQSPGMCSWVVRTIDDNGTVSLKKCVGVGMTFDGSKGCRGNAIVMVCSSPTRMSSGWVLPPYHHNATVVWSRGSVRTNNCDAESQLVSQAAESIAYAWRLINRDDRKGCSTTTDTSATTRIINRYKEQVKASRIASSLAGPSTPTVVSGLTRSVLTFSAVILANRETERAVRRVCDDVVAGVARARDGNDIPATSFPRTCSIDPACRKLFDVRTPCTTPSNPFAIGMHLSECVRFAYSSIHSKQAPLIASIVPVSPTQESLQETTNPCMRPWALLHPLDIEFDRRTDAPTQTVFTKDDVSLDEISAAVSVTVCADRAVPIMSALRDLVGDLTTMTADENKLSSLRQYRSLLFMSGVQCTTLNEFSNAVSSRDMNTSIDGTSKIHNPDNHRCGFFTPFQTYVVGNSNIPKMFGGTSWDGAYGASYDCGSVASVGNNGKHVVSDGRLPIKAIMMSDAQVDELCAALGPHTVVPTITRDGTQYFEFVPTELWGIPRYMIPGVHTALRGLCAAFKRIRRRTHSDDCDTVMSIQVLPFSPFTEAVSPEVNLGVWKGFREKQRPNEGWATYRSDSTLHETSVLSSELFTHSCRVKMTQPDDNVFEKVDSYAASVFVMMTQIGCIAQCLHCARPNGVGLDAYDNVHDAMQTLKSVCDRAHTRGPSSLSTVEAVLAFDALVLLNCCAPTTFKVGERVVLRAYSRGSNEAFLHGCKGIDDLPSESGPRHVSTVEKEEAHRYWSKLRDRAWKETTELVCMLHRHACTFKNTKDDLARCAGVFEQWVRGLWKLHSQDGHSPPESWSPMHGCKSPSCVNASHVNCVFTDRSKATEESGGGQRAAVFGLSNNAPNQILSLLTAAFLPGITVNHARNEGNICLRATCSALKRQENGALPSLKATSPVNSENDWEAFGTFAAKEAQAKRQQKAWDVNNELIFRATKRMMFDREFSGSKKGSSDSFDFVSFHSAALSIAGTTSSSHKRTEAEIALAAKF